LSKLVCVTGTLENLNLNFFFVQKYGVAAIFFLRCNKNVPSAEILRGQPCLRTRTFILFGLIDCNVTLFFIAGYSQLRPTTIILFRSAFIFQSWSEN
jgi:hypothetical protein